MIYLVERTDQVDYDEYESVVVAARDEAHALELAKTLNRPRGAGCLPPRGQYFSNANVKITMVDPEEFKIILESFIAG